MIRAVASAALLLGACAAPGASTETSPAGGARSTIFVSEGGMVRPLENGARVALASGGAAAVSFSPFPPGREAALEVVLEGTDAEVSVSTSMVGMDHGAAVSRAAREGGRHRAALSFPMPSTYRIAIEVARPGAHDSVVLIVAGGG